VAFDIYSTPVTSDEPELVFSIAGKTMNSRRRRLTSEAVQQLLCLRSWQRSEVITLNTRLMRQAVLPASTGDSDGNGDDECGDDGSDNGSLRDDGELLYHGQIDESSKSGNPASSGNPRSPIRTLIMDRYRNLDYVSGLLPQSGPSPRIVISDCVHL
jgi:hypothetical protein